MNKNKTKNKTDIPRPPVPSWDYKVPEVRESLESLVRIGQDNMKIQKSIYETMQSMQQSTVKNRTSGFLYGLCLLTGLSIGVMVANYFPIINNKGNNIMTEIKKKENNTAPKLSMVLEHTAIYGDDNAIGMKGYAVLNSDVISLSSRINELHKVFFEIPDTLRTKYDNFKIFAVDRDGNQSEETKVYAFKGYASTVPIVK